MTGAPHVLMDLLRIATSVDHASDARDATAEVREISAHLRESPPNADEIAELTCGLAASGGILDWASEPRLRGKTSVDLPSTGGASNKTPIIAPLLALAAAPDKIFVPKMSSRGRVAGTIDILESIGYRATLALAEYRETVAATGISNVVQSPDFASADGHLMRLRREAGAMNIPSLVVSSILAKKIATGCRNVVVDLKAGDDSKFGDLSGVIAGAHTFMQVGDALRKRGLIDGLWIVCTNGYRPQGRAFGRRAAMWEAAQVLRGAEHGFLEDLSVALAARMLVLAGAAPNVDAASHACRALLGDTAIAATAAWLSAHDARTDFLRAPDTLLDEIDQVPVGSEAGGVLLHVDSNEIAGLVEKIAREPGGFFAAGLVLDQDPAEGRPVHQPLGGRLLGPPGSPAVLGGLGIMRSAVRLYHGALAVRERPPVLCEWGVLQDGSQVESVSWERTSQASAAIIRRGSLSQDVLLVFNRKWQAWNLLAGHVEVGDGESADEAMKREVAEELGPELGESAPTSGIDFHTRLLGAHHDVWWSESTHAWTYYDIKLYAVTFVDAEVLEAIVRRHPSQLCWASEQEVREGRRGDASSISPFPAATILSRDGALGGL